VIAFERPLVVIGVGNVLLRDDAVGIRVVEALRDLADRDPATLPAGTELVDGGTLVLELLAVVKRSRSLVLVDAVSLGDPAGTVTARRGEAIMPAGGAHNGGATDGVAELLAVGRLLGWLPDHIVLVGVEVAEVEFGTELSPPVAAALPAAVDAVLHELREMDKQVAAARVTERSTPRLAGAMA
jgi:hydrogenase maturation protease